MHAVLMKGLRVKSLLSSQRGSGLRWSSRYIAAAEKYLARRMQEWHMCARRDSAAEPSLLSDRAISANAICTLTAIARSVLQ
jgi:hypothetical protein